MHYTIVAAGEMRSPAFWKDYFATHHGPVWSVDGGLKHCQSLGIIPDLWIGDGDSSSSGNTKELKEVIALSRDKDVSDTQAAIQLAWARGASSIALLGGCGLRLDHQQANLQLLAYHPRRLVLLDGDLEACALDAGDPFVLKAKPEETISLMPVGREPAVLSSEGLKYNLQRQLLRSDSHGVSNTVMNATVKIQSHRGTVLLLRVWEPYSNRSPITS